MRIETLDRRHLTESEARPVAELLVKVFPRRGFDERLAKLVGDWRHYRGPEEAYPRSFIIREHGKVLAHASATPRSIVSSEGELLVLALAHVATDPEARGRKLGQAVVRAAFDLVDHGPFAHAVFQTASDVRPFYEKLGAGVVTNPIIDSFSGQPRQSPFWDDVVMRYPAAKHWPPGPIDIRGPGW